MSVPSKSAAAKAEAKATEGRYISRRRKKESDVPDLRHIIAYRNVMRLEHHFIAIIGDVRTGRNTILRRFVHISSGPFQQSDGRSYQGHPVLVDLSQRPRFQSSETINLCPLIFKESDLDQGTLVNVLSQVECFAVVMDLSRRVTYHGAIHLMVRIARYLGPRTPMFIFLGNKCDLPNREVTTESGIDMAEIHDAQRYYECSALMNINMDLVLDAILIMCLQSVRPPAQF